MEIEKKFVKLVLNSGEINHLVVSLHDGRIIESGESDAEQNTFENTYVDVSTIEIGKPPKISFNYFLYKRKSVNKTPVWVDLNYNVESIEELQIKLENDYE
jgi:hypothetical protein